MIKIIIYISRIDILFVYEMIASEDEVFDIDKKTGKPIRRKVGTFLSDFGNGYRYDKSELEFNIAVVRLFIIE